MISKIKTVKKKIKRAKKIFKVLKKKKVQLVIKAGLVMVAAILLLIGGLITLYHLAYAEKIYPRVMMGSVEISNLTIEEAERRLARLVPKEMPTMEVRFNNQVWLMELKDFEVSYEPLKTAQQAYLLGRDRDWKENAKTKWSLWRRGGKISMEVRVDEAKLEELIKMVAGQVDEPEIMPRLKLNGEEIELVAGKNGRRVKQEELREMILEKIGYLEFGAVEVEVKTMEVAVTEESVEKTKERAEKLKGESLRIRGEGEGKKIAGEELLGLLDFKGGFDEEKIASQSMMLAQKINRPAQDAVFQFDGNRVMEFKPAWAGLRVNEEMTNELIKKNLGELEERAERKEQLKEGEEVEERDKREMVVELVVESWEPKIKTEQVNDLGIRELLGKGESTFHGSIASREHNVALTAGRLNGILLAPGEVFSFNQAVGDISAATGYRSAYIIKDGRTVLGDGGGVCQDSTTVFRAALAAGLPIVERHPHSYRVGYYEQNAPAGIDATVYAPRTDLKFKNDTPAHILIQTKVNTGSNYLAVEIYGTNDGRVSTISNTRLWDQTPPPEPLYQDDPTLPAGTVKQVDWAAWGGRAAFDWKVMRGGEVLQQRTFYSSYQPWQAVYLRGTGG